jgi:hypothetical protein
MALSCLLGWSGDWLLDVYLVFSLAGWQGGCLYDWYVQCVRENTALQYFEKSVEEVHTNVGHSCRKVTKECGIYTKKNQMKQVPHLTEKQHREILVPDSRRNERKCLESALILTIFK